MKNENDALEAVINKYSDTLYKICFVILKDEQDVRDVLQETFLTYYLKRPQFKSAEHRKAWLIKVSQNKCREFLRFHKRHATVSLESIDENNSLYILFIYQRGLGYGNTFVIRVGASDFSVIFNTGYNYKGEL